MQNQHTLYTLKTILYIMAGLVLVLGLVIGISLLASVANVRNTLMPLMLLGSDAIINMVAPLVKNLVSGLGVFTLVISVVLSLLLYAGGRLLEHIASLEERLARLEAGNKPARPAG